MNHYIKYLKNLLSESTKHLEDFHDKEIIFKTKQVLLKSKIETFEEELINLLKESRTDSPLYLEIQKRIKDCKKYLETMTP